MYLTLLFMAIFPVLLLCYYIYRKDVNKEPFGLLLVIFFLGFLMALPVIFIELLLGGFLPTDGVTDFYKLFINIFLSVALVEEGAKWFVTKTVGYNSKSFDEIYDIIVYAVFASLGFACIENIFYVVANGMIVAVVRALLSVPGHMCFAVFMGYFFARAKVSILHNSKKLYVKNMFLSLVVPSFLHAMYDTLLFYSVNVDSLTWMIIFLIYFIGLFIAAFKMVKYISRIQNELCKNNYKFNNIDGNDNC